MANEIQIQTGLGSATLYFIIRNATSQAWNGTSFENYISGDYALYVNSMSEQGSLSGFYAGTFPSSIPPGVYSISVLKQSGGSPAEGDPFVGGGDYQWNGQVTLPLSFLATSGQVSNFAPIKIYRGEQVTNFPFYLVSSLDHVTQFTSGVCSGQVSKDGGAFGPITNLPSETGLGIYNVTLTSGDLLCNTASLRFTGAGVSGGLSDPRIFTLVLQRTSLSGSI